MPTVFCGAIASAEGLKRRAVGKLWQREDATPTGATKLRSEGDYSVVDVNANSTKKGVGYASL